MVLANQLGGTVVADAIKFQAAGASIPRSATWGLPVTTTGTYDVYARWAADAANATNATYTVHYAGGTTVVPMNQTQNGGQWNLLGTFTLNPALNPMVELSDQANGRVVADAVMVVPSGVSTDHVTWTPTLTSSGMVDIYVKWSESATRAQAVTYTVQHAGGSTDIIVNQQQPSAGWFRLGAFSMAPGQNHHVEVTGALEGVTVADAVRFVSAGTSAPGINYVHTDHLGSPQKMTDASKAIVWDAVYTPFGQVHSITGTATNNQRFPGQYADAETGYSYNYFRDYDSTTGRYVQSDPVGLRGGLNMFSYVGSNPVRWIDRFGLLTEIIVWEPVGWGPSSFGHVSTNIDGTTYSFGPDGLTVEPTTDYLARNDFRDGVGSVLKLTPEQEKALKKCLKANPGSYNTLTNNCGDPVEDCLKKLGSDLGSNLFPVSLGNTLLDIDIVEQVNFYEPTSPATGSSAPWAK